ncbi:MAG TPA: ATP-binding protein [Chitinophagaceae bacterium]|nr:ATP-binding protein [Chitinophagaceae bacterium]
MEAPFLYGKTVTEDAFTNRSADIKRLTGNLQNHINTILISPRRWGKSSLVKKVTTDIKTRNTRIIMLDLMSIRNEEEFYKVLATETIKATSNKLTEWIETGREFLKHLTPKISLGTNPLQDFDISFEWKELEKNYKEILNLPQKIAKKKKLHLIICIDEFQNCESFRESKFFQKRLRTEWQHHHQVTYCLYGSRQHMMTELFEKQSNPFYKFGDVLYLPKISRNDWISFIQEQFRSTKKNIVEGMANLIAAMVQDHSYYVQQLSYLVWIATSKTVTSEIIMTAVDDLLAQNAILYTRETENLTNIQFNFLKALAEGVHTGLSSKEVVNKYQLGTSANVLKIKKVLIQKELIDDQAGIYFLDPVYELWFKKNMLHQKIEI